MSIRYLLGIGEKRIFALDHAVEGRITQVKKCWWIKVNTKPVRAHMWDGAKYPHIAYFVYTVNGVEYTGKRWVSYDDTPPQAGAQIKVYCDPADPSRYAVKL